MKARYLTAATLAAVIAVAGCSSSKSTGSSTTPTASAPAAAASTPAAAASTPAAAASTPAAAASTPAAAASGTLTVWLQTDAQTGWPKEVAAATAAFNAKNPGVKVDVQYQTWADHLTKLDAALAASPPDVVELGNTETTKYMADGALADITADKAKFDNSGHVAQGPRRLRDLQRQAVRRARTTQVHEASSTAPPRSRRPASPPRRPRSLSCRRTA